MKKLLLLNVIALTVMACPNDDDGNDPNENQFIGTWKYFMYIENDVEETLDPCEDDVTLIVNADGTLSVETFNLIDGNCETEDFQNGTWSNPNGNTYSITTSGETDTNEIVFESNTFYIEYADDNGTPTDTTDDIVSRDVFIRQ